MKHIFALTVVAAVVALPVLTFAATLERQLEVGMTGTDVSALQTYLAADPTLYPQGLVTGYYGFLTKSAVSNFQSRNNIPAVGRVGPATLPVLNQAIDTGIIGIDLSAPTITGIALSKSNTSATITWSTDAAARGKLYYSTLPIRLSNTYDQTGVNSVEPGVSGTLASYDGLARGSQSVPLTGLTPNTTYYYQIVILDSANNTSISLPASFYTN